MLQPNFTVEISMPGYLLSGKWLSHCWYLTTDFRAFNALDNWNMYLRSTDWRSFVWCGRKNIHIKEEEQEINLYHSCASMNCIFHETALEKPMHCIIWLFWLISSLLLSYHITRRDARAVMLAGVANWWFTLKSTGGENVSGIPGACATRNFTSLVRGPLIHMELVSEKHSWIIETLIHTFLAVPIFH